MSSRSREVSKFLSGVAFHEAAGHVWLGFWGASLMPWKMAWFTFTEEMNSVAMIVWPIVFFVLVWYGWGAQKQVTETRTPTVGPLPQG